jgi:hypothetical protein
VVAAAIARFYNLSVHFFPRESERVHRAVERRRGDILVADARCLRTTLQRGVFFKRPS